ncbi:archaeal proteasome endopeptidase complex subunit beta [Candidatus Micrarchaeota archaeon]|nr:archaeal proteasome endopeptidase complex subunit beta [Candidatus Micrarchaeota archaeon]
MDYGNVLKGTTTVGLIFSDGVVLAADKRATMGNFIAIKDIDKILMVSDRIAFTTAGGVGDAQQLVRVMRAELELYLHQTGEPLSVKGASTLLANILQGNKYFPYLVQIIVGGVDKQPRIFSLDPVGGLNDETKYVSTGSGSVTAYGVLDAGFKAGLSKSEAVKLAASAVSGAMKRDSASGEAVDVVVITASGVERIAPADVAKIIA